MNPKPKKNKIRKQEKKTIAESLDKNAALTSYLVFLTIVLFFIVSFYPDFLCLFINK